MADRRSLWLNTQERVGSWRRLGVSEYLDRYIQFGVFESPSQPFRDGEVEELPDIPQSVEDRAYALEDLTEGCRSGIYKEVSRAHVLGAKKKGAIISSAFTTWKDKGGEKKGRFVVNLSKQSTHWK